MTDHIDADKLREQAIDLRALHHSLDGLSVDKIDGIYFRALVSAIGAHADMLESLLPTPTPRTMADIEWRDEVHSGLCAEHPEHGIVRMICQIDSTGTILAHRRAGYTLWLDNLHDLTPIPGTRLDLTPTSEPEAEDGKPGQYQKFIDTFPALDPIMDEPESINEGNNDAPPTALATEVDYENAPTGTVVWGRSGKYSAETAIEKRDWGWMEPGLVDLYGPDDMERHGPHQILRWGDDQ